MDEQQIKDIKRRIERGFYDSSKPLKDITKAIKKELQKSRATTQK